MSKINLSKMENIQINGQKIWGPPKDWVGPPPPYGTEVFIKNIPDDVFEDELFYLFSTIGKVYEVRLPVHWTGKNKGYAFVRFTNISEADAALEKLNQCMIRPGRHIKIERSLDNTRLFLSSLPNNKTAEEIKSDLLTVVENVKTVYVYPALENPTMFRGYAFIEFVSHRDAAIAKRILTPDVLFNMFERKCIAAWANPLPFLNNDILKNINILFMRNIPSNTKSVGIRMAVDNLISPDNVHKVKRLNDFAFLTFKNHEQAERAMIKIKSNPFLLGIKAVHVEWAIPRELVNSFSSKDLNIEKDSGSELNFEPRVESCHSVSPIIDDYKMSDQKFIIDNYDTNYLDNNQNGNWMNNYNNSNYLNNYKNTNWLDNYSNKNWMNETESNKFRNFESNVDIGIFDKNSCKSESSPVPGIFETSLDKVGLKVNLPNGTYQNNLNEFINLSKFLCRTSNLKKTTDDQRFISEFQSPGSENDCKNKHLKNWLRSLAGIPIHQFTVPSISTPSICTSTNFSLK